VLPVLSCGGLLTGAPPDFHVSFQNKQVGGLQDRCRRRLRESPRPPDGARTA
jgi:hypothetical protein